LLVVAPFSPVADGVIEEENVEQFGGQHREPEYAGEYREPEYAGEYREPEPEYPYREQELPEEFEDGKFNLIL